MARDNQTSDGSTRGGILGLAIAYAVVAPFAVCLAIEKAADHLLGKKRSQPINTITGWLECIRRGIIAGMIPTVAAVIAVASVNLPFPLFWMCAVAVLGFYISAVLGLYCSSYREPTNNG